MTNTMAYPGYRDPDDEFEDWLEQRGTSVPLADAPDKFLKYSEIIQLLDKEEDWGKAHHGLVDPEYLKGFLAGLLQSKHLITQLAHLNKKRTKLYGRHIRRRLNGSFDKDANRLEDCT